MLIGETSPLRRLPSQLNRKQILYFDGIRYSIEMADLAHTRLRQTLFEITQNRGEQSSKSQEFASAMLDAWSIVDAVHRLRGLLNQAPGIKQNSPGLRLFAKKTEDIGKLRNAVQHLNEQINKIVNLNLPVWGVLSWSTILDSEFKSVWCCTLVAGTLFESKGHLIVNPLGKEFFAHVDLITLVASNHSVCLSDTMREVGKLVGKMEESLKEQFKDLPHCGSDVLICAEISFDKDNAKGTS